MSRLTLSGSSLLNRLLGWMTAPVLCVPTREIGLSRGGMTREEWDRRGDVLFADFERCGVDGQRDADQRRVT